MDDEASKVRTKLLMLTLKYILANDARAEAREVAEALALLTVINTYTSAKQVTTANTAHLSPPANQVTNASANLSFGNRYAPGNNQISHLQPIRAIPAPPNAHNQVQPVAIRTDATLGHVDNQNNNNVQVNSTQNGISRRGRRAKLLQPIRMSDGRFGCPYQGCTHSYKHITNCRNHERTHTINALICQFCDRRFGKKSNFQIHVKTHLKPAPFRCDLCSQCFRDMDRRNKHEQLEHGVLP